jgi:hypothetical protein
MHKRNTAIFKPIYRNLEIAPIRLYDDAWLPPEASGDLKYASSEVDLKLEE